MAGDGEAALPIIDEALVVGQRLGLTDTVGDLLASKGWALGVTGRPVEASVLLRGAVWFAERERLVRPEFRSRMNLSAWTQRDDSRETLEITQRGMERAQRLGLDEWVYPLAGNAMDSALQLGEWDWIEATAAELRVEEQVIVWRAAPMEMLQIVAAFRGDDGRVESLRERLARLTAGHEDPQLAATALATRVFVSYSRRDLGDAVEALQELRDRQLGRTEERLVERMIGFAVRDRQLLVGQTVTTGRADAAGLDMAIAARDVLDGNPTRLEAVDEAIDRIDAAGHQLFAAIFRRERALLAPDDPGARASAQAAAAWFRGVGAVTMLAGLEPFLDPQDGASEGDRTEATTTA